MSGSDSFGIWMIAGLFLSVGIIVSVTVCNQRDSRPRPDRLEIAIQQVQATNSRMCEVERRLETLERPKDHGIVYGE